MDPAEEFEAIATRYGYNESITTIYDMLQIWLEIIRKKQPSVCGMAFNPHPIPGDPICKLWEDFEDFREVLKWATIYRENYPEACYALWKDGRITEYPPEEYKTFFLDLYYGLKWYPERSK